MQYGSWQDLVFQERFVVVSPNDSSILRQARRMSFRKEASCLINDPEVFENFGAHPWLQSTLADEVDLAPGQTRQFLRQQFKLDHTDTCVRQELHHDVDVAIRTHLSTGHGPKQRKFLDTVTAAHLRQRLAVNDDIAKLNSQLSDPSIQPPLCLNAPGIERPNYLGEFETCVGPRRPRAFGVLADSGELIPDSLLLK